MSRYFIPAIVLAAAPLSLAAAEPTPAPDSTPPANCPQIQQHMGNGAMGSGTMQGQMQQQQHGAGGMGHGTMGNGAMAGTMPGTMQVQQMQHGNQAGMGPGNHQAMMQGQCPVASPPPESGQSATGK